MPGVGKLPPRRNMPGSSAPWQTELCHLHHRDHTGAFWNEVDKVLPDFRERKEWLRKNGAGLDV